MGGQWVNPNLTKPPLKLRGSFAKLVVISLVKYATGIMRELRLLIYYPNCEAQAATINFAYGRCILPQQFISTEQPSRAVFLTTTPRWTRVRTNDFACGFLSVATVGWCIDSPIFTRLTWLSMVNYDDPSEAGEACLKIWVNWRADNATTTKNDKKPVYILWDLPCFNSNWDICLFSLELRHILDTNHLWSQNQLTAYKKHHTSM